MTDFPIDPDRNDHSHVEFYNNGECLCRTFGYEIVARCAKEGDDSDFIEPIPNRLQISRQTLNQTTL